MLLKYYFLLKKKSANTKKWFDEYVVLCYAQSKTIGKLQELDFELLPHPPYSPDLSPSYFLLF